MINKNLNTNKKKTIIRAGHFLGVARDWKPGVGSCK